MTVEGEQRTIRTASALKTPAWSVPIALRFLRRLILACRTQTYTLQAFYRFWQSLKNTKHNLAPHYLPMLHVRINRRFNQALPMRVKERRYRLKIIYK